MNTAGPKFDILELQH